MNNLTQAASSTALDSSVVTIGVFNEMRNLTAVQERQIEAATVVETGYAKINPRLIEDALRECSYKVLGTAFIIIGFASDCIEYQGVQCFALNLEDFPKYGKYFTNAITQLSGAEDSRSFSACVAQAGSISTFRNLPTPLFFIRKINGIRYAMLPVFVASVLFWLCRNEYGSRFNHHLAAVQSPQLEFTARNPFGRYGTTSHSDNILKEVRKTNEWRRIWQA